MGEWKTSESVMCDANSQYATPEATPQRLTVGAIGPWQPVVADLPADSLLVEWDMCEADDV